MDTVTLEELLVQFEESVGVEIEAEGLGTWSINTSGSNLLDNFAHCDLEELKELRSEFREGLTTTVTIDLSEYIVDHLSELIRGREDDEDSEDDEEEELNFD